jgi:rubrerythrin
MCIVCLESFEAEVNDPDGTCPLCGAPGPFLEDEDE